MSSPIRVSGSGSVRRSCRRGRAKTPKIGEVLPLLYLHGLSFGRFRARAGAGALGSAKGLSTSTITKLTETWTAEQQAFAQQDSLGCGLRVPVG